MVRTLANLIYMQYMKNGSSRIHGFLQLRTQISNTIALGDGDKYILSVVLNVQRDLTNHALSGFLLAIDVDEDSLRLTQREPCF